MRTLLVAIAAWMLVAASPALAQSTVIPTLPAINAPLASGPVRSNFAAANSDINGLLSMHPVATLGACAANPLVGTDCLVQGSPTLYSWYKYMGTTGYSLVGTFNPSTTPPGFTVVGTSFCMTNATSGSICLVPTTGALGSSVATFPANTGFVAELNLAQVWTAAQTFNLNTIALPSPLTGTVVNIGQVNTVVSRVQNNAFGAISEFTTATYGGTNASPTAVTSGTVLGRFNSYAYNGSTLVGAVAGIEFAAAENIASGHQGSTACFRTTPLASTTLGSGICQQPSSGVTVGSPTGSDEGSGTINVAANYYVNGAIAATTVNGQSCALGGTCTVTASATAVIVGTTVVTGGPGVLYNTTSGGTLTALAPVNSSVVSFTSGGVLQASTTLPSGVSATNMALTTPSLGVATATSINGLTISTSTGTLTIANAKTHVVNNSLTFTGTDATSFAFPGTSDTVVTLGVTQTLTAKTLTTPTINGAALSGTLSGSPTLSGVPVLSGLSAGTCSSGLGLDVSNNTIKISCPGAAASIQDGTTTITSGVSGTVLGNTSGVLTHFTRAVPTVCEINLTTATTCNNGGSSANNGTYTTPTGALYLKVTLVGGGAGGSGGGTAAGTTATAGGNTCFNTTGAACTTPVYQAGGGGAGSWTTGVGGAGGSVSGSSTCAVTVPGTAGSPELPATSAASISGQKGGDTILAGGGTGAFGNVAGNAASANTGGGGQGGGAIASTGVGGPGGGGGSACISYVSSPAATYTYAVAATAAAGGAGTSGSAGGGGAAGKMIIEAFFE